MNDKRELLRGVMIGVLVMMVIRSIVWLADPDAAATTGTYALNVANIAICGLTAWATWKPSAGAVKVLQSVHRRMEK